jgi:hypothetical protein
VERSRGTGPPGRGGFGGARGGGGGGGPQVMRNQMAFSNCSNINDQLESNLKLEGF